MEQTKKYYLSPSELAILLANGGVKRLYGINTEKALDNKDVCMALHNLYVNKLIDNYDSESFQISKELSSIIKGIKEARYVLIVQTEGENGKYICGYLGQEISIVSLKKSMRDKLALSRNVLESLVKELMYMCAEEKINISINKADTGEKVEGLALSQNGEEKQIAQLIEKYCTEE